MICQVLLRNVGAKYNRTFTNYIGTTSTARINNVEDIPSAPVMTDRELVTVELLLEERHADACPPMRALIS